MVTMLIYFNIRKDKAVRGAFSVSTYLFHFRTFNDIFILHEFGHTVAHIY